MRHFTKAGRHPKHTVTPAQTGPHIARAGALSQATISVIIPLYNHARYIAAALNSVLSQTSPADEIVLIDDGSSDDGFAIAEKILAHTPNTILVRQDNAGAHHTLNRAISMSHGAYLAVLNSDDMFMPKKIEHCRRILADMADTDLITGDIAFMNSNGKRIGTMNGWMKNAHSFLDKTNLAQLAQLYRHFSFTTSNMVFSRALWAASGGFQNLRYCHDLDFLMFAYSTGKVYLDRGTEHILYRRHQSNTIAENAQKVDIEVAAIMAHTFRTCGASLLSPSLTQNDIKAFRALLARRKLSDLVLFFMTIAPHFKNRAALYDYATDPRHFPLFQDYLGR
ncbi:glycosyltransferase family A protein [Acidocella sp.]|uniref:glycosyltransferase family 2 protein n=1 Tax=Acidocella sp. TaxID=50710 RepID=UPI0026245498|nr:glycosyltransferase family A protein [Acidocella sp.]